jgi:hypothetical protein
VPGAPTRVGVSDATWAASSARVGADQHAAHLQRGPGGGERRADVGWLGVERDQRGGVVGHLGLRAPGHRPQPRAAPGTTGARGRAGAPRTPCARSCPTGRTTTPPPDARGPGAALPRHGPRPRSAAGTRRAAARVHGPGDRVGGTTPCRSASRILTTPAIAAAPRGDRPRPWRSRAAAGGRASRSAAYTSAAARTSIGSPSFVPVPWHSRKSTSRGPTPGEGERVAQHHLLRRPRRRGQPGAAAVVVDGRAADHAQDVGRRRARRRRAA